MDIVGLLYKLTGKLLMRREHFGTTCTVCNRSMDQYFPYRGAFLWEREYWQEFQPDECCGQPMVVTHNFDGISGVLYRLPGYKAHDKRRFRKLAARLPIR